MLQLEVIGNLGNDAEIKEFSGKKYVSMNVAHSEKKKDGSENTVWVSVLWYGDGGGLFQYLKRGCKVFLRGRLVPKAYTDKQNQPQCALNMYANEVNLCGGKQESTRQDAATTSVAPNPDDDLPF
jgi:single-strand DNA-binding protein